VESECTAAGLPQVKNYLHQLIFRSCATGRNKEKKILRAVPLHPDKEKETRELARSCSKKELLQVFGKERVCGG